MSRAALALLALAPFVQAAPDAGPAGDTAAGLAISKLGRAGFETLRDRGYIVVQGRKSEERIQAAHWKALEQLAGLSGSALRLVESVRGLREGQPAKAAAEDLDRLAALPPQGAMTLELHTAAQALAAIQRQLSALGAEGQHPAPVLAANPPLFSQPWAGKLREETRAELAADPSGLVDRMFSQFLAGPVIEPKAVAHFQEWARRRAAGADARLEGDARAGRVSSELRRGLERYLSEQRRLSELERLHKSLIAHAKTAAVEKQLASLEAAARGLSAQPERVLGLESKPIPAPAAADARIKLTSAGIHMQEPTRLGQYELGDEATVTGGYWVDGLAEGATVDVEQTTFVEHPEGFSWIRTTRSRRGNGGPYPWSARVTVGQSREFTLRAVVSAAGSNALSEKVVVPVSRDFEAALVKLAEADAEVAACRLDAAAYAPLAEQLAAAAKEKKQYAELKKAAEARGKEVKDLQQRLAKLEALIADSHADASQDACRYETKRTVDALAIARKLPAGCDRYAPALERRLTDIRRRKAAQETYARYAKDARAKRDDCAFLSATQRASSALAVLDAEPAARCGAIDADAAKLEAELAQARTAESWRARLAEELAAAEQAPAPDARLARARAAAARAGSLPESRCFEDASERARKIAWSASDSLDALGEGPTVPADHALARVEAEVRAERRKLLEAARTTTGLQDESQAPAQAPAAPPKITPKKSRLQCLEEGFRATKSTIDCEGKPFEILELKRLRDQKAGPAKKPASKPAAKKEPASKKAPAAIPPPRKTQPAGGPL